MAREISKAESWERVYEAYQNINFTAFDYDTVKSSLIDYVKLYFPENFNDFIESSEFVALVELFAYVAELMAYRIDMASHENFISTAQRKQSILRLAKMLSYNASRNIPARGLVKIDTIQTTEDVYDSRGVNLANTKIIWNDPNNSDWKEQFFLVVNRILQQDYGTVSPTDRIQVDDVIFELYSLNNRPLTNGVVSYSAVSSGKSYPMELVPADLTDQGPIERRPSRSNTFTVLYGSDGLGDSSTTTGFFMYTKQGTIRRQTETYDGVTPNQQTELIVSDINETDIWVNNVDPATGETVLSADIDPLGRHLGVQGEWVQVDMANVENILFNTNRKRGKYEIETLEDDGIRVIFGDGEFADIPSGTFDIWYRQSSNDTFVIPRSAVSGNDASLTYQDSTNTTQTFSLTYSLINTLTNSSPSETIERVRRTAPSVYYTQDRMVNGRDYNTYMLQDPSIIKLRSVNRTYAGDSGYLGWHDPSQRYESVKLFGNDLKIYFKENTINQRFPTRTSIDVMIEAVKELMTDSELIAFHVMNDKPTPRRDMYTVEREQITDVYNNTPDNTPFYLVYEPQESGEYAWVAYDGVVGLPEGAIPTFTLVHAIEGWTLSYNTVRVVAESPTTKFWFNNNGSRTIDNSTLNSNYDRIVALNANTQSCRMQLLPGDIDFNVIGVEHYTTSPHLGLDDVTKLSVSTLDNDGDGIPDDILLDGFVSYTGGLIADGDFHVAPPLMPAACRGLFVIERRLRNSNDNWYECGEGVTLLVTNSTFQGGFQLDNYTTGDQLAIDHPNAIGASVDAIRITQPDQLVDYEYRFRHIDYLYAKRDTIHDEFVIQTANEDHYVSWNIENRGTLTEDEKLWTRYIGRDSLNFAWYHVCPRMNLIDPAPTNIIDTFVIPRGYYTSMQQWAAGEIDRPVDPTPLQLRTDYSYMLDSKMISDTVVLHPGKFKVLFGEKADPALQASIMVVRATTGVMTDNEVKVQIVDIVRDFFDVTDWEFGETFNFTELSAYIHSQLFSELKSVVLVPEFSDNSFGDLFQVVPREDELFLPSISVDNISIVDYLSPHNIKQ